MFEIKQDSFYLNGNKFKLYSGTIHYFRVVKEYWEDRLTKLKLAGFNAVETVLKWNMHEPKEGEFNFEGQFDIIAFCKLAQKLGLYVIIRPGPYTCAEWDFGGLPAWLLKDRNIRYRCDDAIFMEKVGNYFQKVLSILNNMQVNYGGNILAMQVENEYGSFGNDHIYMNKLEKLMRDCGVVVPLFTSDGTNPSMLSGGTLPHVYKTLNFGSRPLKAFNSLQNIQPDMPKSCMEFWCGWFDHWAGMHHRRNPRQVSSEIKKIVDMGANINIYMFHGGTNFNFWAGANFTSTYRATVTSYDDAALLNEYGDYTPAYHAVRDVLLNAQGLEKKQLPPSPKLQNIGEVELTKQANLLENLEILGTKHYSSHIETMEYFGQNFGMILYKNELIGNYEANTLYIDGAHDVVYLYINGVLVKKYNRVKKGSLKLDGFTYKLPAVTGKCTIEILVEAMGRINYGPHMVDRKGIENVRLGNQTLFGWDTYTLPLEDFDKVEYGIINKESKYPVILKGSFKAKRDADCFVDMRGFSKGFVLINGFNLGRYWQRGPQRTLYLPAPLLREDNEIIVVEQENYKNPAIKIIDKHLL